MPTGTRSARRREDVRPELNQTKSTVDLQFRGHNGNWLAAKAPIERVAAFARDKGCKHIRLLSASNNASGATMEAMVRTVADPLARRSARLPSVGGSRYQATA